MLDNQRTIKPTQNKRGCAHTRPPGQSGCVQIKDFNGIYCILICLKYICKYFNIKEGKLLIACNFLGALIQALIYNHRLTSHHPDFNILWSVFHLCNETPLELNWRHVYSHQDTAKIGYPLTLLETMNCKVDAGAQEFLRFAQTNNLTLVPTLYRTQR